MKYDLMFQRFQKDGERQNKNYGHLFHFLRYCSYWLSIPFVYLPLTPNQITLLANLIQASAIALIVYLESYYRLYGVLLYFFGDMLDFVDGNIARYSNQTSKKGVFYDQIGHVLIAPIFYCGIGLIAYNSSHEIIYLYATIAMAMFVPLMSYQIAVSPNYFNADVNSADDIINRSAQSKILWFLKKIIAYFYHFKMELLILAIIFNLIELLALFSSVYFVGRFFIQLYLDQRLIE